MRPLLIALIRGYQRWLSPRKGFQCAYHRHTGRATCSTLGLRAVRRYGVVGGLRVLRERFAACGEAHDALRGGDTLRVPRLQRGSCDLDLPCDFDLPGGSSGRGCDANTCPCDWPTSRRRRRRRKAPRDGD
jgi:putative component of membrane protein insertase Oxa1/YidC/SpoIIIJ protein YidD